MEYFRKFLSIIKYYKIRFFHNFDSLNDIKDKKIIYFPLHYQPEASIDVIGYISNQIEIIKMISQRL